MKKITIIIYLFLIGNIFAQDNFIKLIDTKKNEPMLIGEIKEANFLDSAFYSWFTEESDYYAVDTLALKEIKNDVQNIGIEIVMGTWCSDSRREVPHLLKILNFLRYNEADLTITAVDRKKKALNAKIDKYNIELVPTFIFLKSGNEIGRITETPIHSLEVDLAEIILHAKD